MTRMQYQAGYFLNCIFDLFSKQAGKDKIDKILFQLGHFDLETKDDLKHTKVEYISEIKTILNIIQRGIPTIPPVFIEDLFCTTFGITKRQVSASNHISYTLEKDSISDEIYKSIHIIEPRVTLESQREVRVEESKSTGMKGTRFDFKYSYFPEYLGHYFIQLFEENRTFNSIIQSSECENPEHLQQQFEQIAQRKQDFVLEMPYAWHNEKGIAIELDDTPSETSYDFETDQLKQALCKKINWAKALEIETHRLDEIHNQLRPLIDFTYNEYFDMLAKNYRSPLYKTSDGLTAIQMTLSPLAVARIERTVLEYLLSGKLSLDDQNWKIAVIERDVPCAYIAFQDLRLHFENLFALKEEHKKFPEIKLSIFRTEEFKKAQLNQIYPGEIKSIDNFDEKTEFDLLIDISILQRSGLLNNEYKTNAKNSAVIRSVRSISTKFQFQTDKAVNYIDLNSDGTSDKIKDRARDALKYFLRNIFRKDGFLPGQIQLINNILQQKNTLGLLPPAGGKTIAFQLPAFLQPGLTFIVCPNTNLISNQLTELNSIKINHFESFDGLQSNSSKLKRKYKKLENGQIQFVYLNPAYLRKKEFRDTIGNIEYNKVFISHLVIDEAHSVSEWGHSFNPQYQHLGHIKDQIFKNPVRQKIPVIGLTGTANYSTIYDIQREFIINSDSIVKSNISQTKVKLKWIEISSEENEQENTDGEEKTSNNVLNEENIAKVFKEIISDGKSKTGQSSLIYYLHSNGEQNLTWEKWNDPKEKNLSYIAKLRIGHYLGSPEDSKMELSKADLLKSNQASVLFQQNQYDLLFAEAGYGVGVDKQNINNIIYLNLPGSVESFIQQTSRGGRNGENFKLIIFLDKREMMIPEASGIGKYTGQNITLRDKYFAYRELLSTYKGRKKETALLEQLWNGFKAESISHAEIILRTLEEKYKIKAELQFQPAEKPRRIYINEGTDTFGYVDLNDFSISIDESLFEPSLSEEILYFLADEINKRLIERENDPSILLCPVHSENQITIASLLKNTLPGSRIEASIPFENDSIEKLQKLLNGKCSTHHNKQKLRQIYQASLNEIEFLKRIELINPFSEDSRLIEEICNLYQNTWNKRECQLAIHRISKSGLIEDYLEDEINQQFIIKLRKNEEQFYIKKLFHLYDLFLLPEKAAEEKKSNYGSNLFNILVCHIDFFYNYILKFRFESIENIFQIFDQISKIKSGHEELNACINELIERYFTAKYAIGCFSLVPGTRSLMAKEQSPSLIKEHLLHIGALKENLFHLKKSALLISRIKPDNYSTGLLEAYSRIIFGEQNEELIDSALNQIVRSFISMRKKIKINDENYQSEIRSFLDIIYQYRPDLKEKYEPVFWLRMHYMWLKDFNTKMNQS